MYKEECLASEDRRIGCQELAAALQGRVVRHGPEAGVARSLAREQRV